MRVVPQAMTNEWKAAYKGGDASRPTVRATVLVANMKSFEYDTAYANGGDSNFVYDRHRAGTFTSFLFGDPGPITELRNIQTITWTRSIDQDVATCTMTLLNSEIVPIGQPQDRPEDFDQTGYFTYSRGETTIDANRWGHTSDLGWRGVLVPDRLVRTYEGYGADRTKFPAEDPNLVQTGTWLIDKVALNSDGMIQVEMRDVGRLLMDQIVFPPVIPYAEYPLSWERITTQNVTGRDTTGGSWELPVGTATSSNALYIGKGLTDPPYPSYVGSGGGFNGHRPADAQTTGADDTYWLSTGQDSRTDKVWWEVALSDTTTAMNGVRINAYGGPYRVYISLENDKGWIGKKKIPYEVGIGGVDIGAGIPFVMSVWADRNWPFDVTLPRKYKNIKRVRLTFTHLWDTIVGDHAWRAGLKAMRIYTAGSVDQLGFAQGEVWKVVGNYGDYTQIIKWACAWGGFFWPPHETGLDYQHIAPGGTNAGTGNRTISYAHADATLPIGAVWGDFMPTGTYGIAPLTVDLFDKKPLLDMINYVRDIVGFLFFIDETGAVVWRYPNLWALGNYLSPGDLGQRVRGRTSDHVTLDENETLIHYETTLDSRDVRERLFVGNQTGKVGTVIKGFVPYATGMRRIAGWTDQHFATKNETRITADLISARQMFTYRESKVTIPGYPAIQIDDQIRIFERVTNETYYHYVKGITSTLNTQDGTWEYQLDTHWLGERPQDAWVVKVDELADVTKAYINAVTGGLA